MKPSAGLLAAITACLVSATVHAQTVVWVHDGRNLPVYRARGHAAAQTDLKAGNLKFYLPVCTFPAADDDAIRAYGIRKALYKAAGVTAMADVCNDLVPDAAQQEAFVAGYNAVMHAAIVKKLGSAWQASIDKQVKVQLRKRPAGTFQARDSGFDPPY